MKTWHIGTHLRALNESYSMKTNMTGFRWFSNVLASALKELRYDILPDAWRIPFYTKTLDSSMEYPPPLHIPNPTPTHCPHCPYVGGKDKIKWVGIKPSATPSGYNLHRQAADGCPSRDEFHSWGGLVKGGFSGREFHTGSLKNIL